MVVIFCPVCGGNPFEGGMCPCGTSWPWSREQNDMCVEVGRRRLIRTLDGRLLVAHLVVDPDGVRAFSIDPEPVPSEDVAQLVEDVFLEARCGAVLLV